MRTFQDRLGFRHDKIRAKLVNNSISLAGSAVDTIRIKVKRNKTGDIETRTIMSNDVISVVFPPLIDIPMRRLRNTNGTFTIDSLSVQEIFPFELRVGQSDNIERDDLLIRLIRDPKVDQPYVIVLQAKDELGTVGSQSLIWTKINATYYDEVLPQDIIDIVVSQAQRRIVLGW